MAGPDGASLDPVPELSFRNPSSPMGQPPALFTGDAVMPWPGGFEPNARIAIAPSGPFPCTLIGIYPQLITQDR
jgi:hypothetical protein